MAFLYPADLIYAKEAAATHVYNTNIKSYWTDPRLSTLCSFSFFGTIHLFVLCIFTGTPHLKYMV